MSVSGGFLLTGISFPHKGLTLHSTADGVDVEAVECAWLQVGDVSVCVGWHGQLQGPKLSAIWANGWEDHSVTRDLSGWTSPGDGDLHIWDLVELQVCWGWDLLCGQKVEYWWTMVRIWAVKILWGLLLWVDWDTILFFVWRKNVHFNKHVRLKLCNKSFFRKRHLQTLAGTEKKSQVIAYRIRKNECHSLWHLVLML